MVYWYHSKDENCVYIVEDLFKCMNCPAKVENAHRIGNSEGDRPRMIICKFYSRIDRLNILRKKPEFKKRKNIIVLEDLCTHDLNIKRSLKDVMEAAYHAGRKVFFRQGKRIRDPF